MAYSSQQPLKREAPGIHPGGNVTARELRKAERAYRSAMSHAESRRAERNATVLQALADGWTHTQIAAETGLTRGRIGHLSGRRTA